MKVILGHFNFCYHSKTAYDSIIDIPTRFSRSVRHFHQNSPFSHDRGSWVILKFGELRNLSSVRRSFQLNFFPNNPRDVPQLKAFQRLFRCFETFGATRSLTPRGRHRGRKMSPRLLVRGTRRRWHVHATGIVFSIMRCWRRWCGHPYVYRQPGEGSSSSRTARRCTSYPKSWISSGRSSATVCSPGGPSTTGHPIVRICPAWTSASGPKYLKKSRSECQRPSMNWRPSSKASPAGWTATNWGAWRDTPGAGPSSAALNGEGTSSTSCRRTKCHSWLSFVLC